MPGRMNSVHSSQHIAMSKRIWIASGKTENHLHMHQVYAIHHTRTLPVRSAQVVYDPTNGPSDPEDP